MFFYKNVTLHTSLLKKEGQTNVCPSGTPLFFNRVKHSGACVKIFFAYFSIFMNFHYIFVSNTADFHFFS